MSIFSKIWAWIKNDAVPVEKKAVQISIGVTEGLQTALKSGVLGFIAKFIETVFPQVHNLPEQLVTILQNNVPKVLALELALSAPPANASEEEILAFEQKVLAAFNLTDNKSKLYSVIAAQVASDVSAFAAGPDHTFAAWVRLIDEEFIKIKADVDAAAVEG